MTDLKIINVNKWKVNSKIAVDYVNKNKYYDNKLIYIGDFAHQTPPSGGFGMNLGIQDAFDLANLIKKY